ncbi:MAG: phosphatidylserine/phosphatidylglycerophosphate/cardiolipin synthase family protein [Phormidesmis sp. RL_2_1]|nr:phosphatidylserine/phosphatidylglycerophosphate/cardiolipin synthase family protein [Phormidesmis sp. RL_2_1]
MGLLLNIFQWSVVLGAAVVALVLLSLYIRGAFRWRPVFQIEAAIAPQDARFLLILKSLTESVSTTGNVIGFWHTADSIQKARLAAIESAQHSIQFETFIMTPGKRAQDFAEAVARRAAEGIKVQLLVDSWGTRKLPMRYWHHLHSAGVQIVFFNPFDIRAPANYAGRTHRKLLIIDGDRVWIGGAGISDLWDGSEKADDTGPWFDIEAAFTGEIVTVLSTVFQSHWQGYKPFQTDKATVVNMTNIWPADQPQRRHASAANASDMMVALGTKPSYRDSPIEITKQTLLACARDRIWLSSPYFLPNKSTRNLLIAAQQSGIDVRILTTSERSDKKPVYYASYEVYGTLLQAGINIFEYQPSMSHAKMLIIDHAWVNMGSANLDYRSFLHNDELDIVTNSQLLLQQVEQVFQQGFANSRQISLTQWQNRAWLKHRMVGNAVRLVQWQL